MNEKRTRIAVVIPFFQQEKGILARAIRSVLAQRLDRDVALSILVVDDASPVSAQSELEGTSVPAPHDLLVFSQPNAGPGGARNTALDRLDPRDISLVAFLDSDDEWLPDHLSTAVAALADRHDFYFCDHVRDARNTCFSQSRVMREWNEGQRQPAPLPDTRHDDLASLPARAAFDAFLEEYLGQTSTVVYRFDLHPDLRFDTALRYAGEDHMFWLSLLDAARSAVFSRRVNVRCGRGVNIFFSAMDWKNPKAAARAGYLMVYRLKLRRFVLDPLQAARIDEMIGEDRKVYAYLLFRNALRGRLPDRHALAQVGKTSLKDTLALPFMLPQMLLRRGT